jgi:hypothetical protein
MNYFNLPKINNELSLSIIKNENIIVSYSCLYYFKNLKQIINNVDSESMEYINIPIINQSYLVANLIEIIKTLNLLNDKDNKVVYSKLNIAGLLAKYGNINKTDDEYDIGIYHVNEKIFKQFFLFFFVFVINY